MDLEASLPGEPAERPQYTIRHFALHHFSVGGKPLDKGDCVG
jgi:hypothetical protein